MSFQVEALVNLAEVDAKLKQTMRLIRLGKSLILAEMGAHGFHFMRGIAPRRTGRLVESIQTEGSESRMVVGPTVHYAPFVEYGTRASPGRYVPAIGKRLVDASLPYFGWHPGIEGQHFVDKTREEMIAYGRRVAERIMGEVLD